MAILCDIMKLSKEVKYIDLLKVMYYNNRPTSLVEVSDSKSKCNGQDGFIGSCSAFENTKKS
jgi:hypothetical protein